MSIKLKINGKPFTVNLTTLPVDISLNTFIREHAGLSGTKFMCLEGGCGACVCVVKGAHPVSGEERTWAVNSCLTLLSLCADLEITTIEGLGNKRDGYHPLQKTLAKLNGTQCGYCSPGIIMNMYGLLESKDNKITMEEVENSFGGNICRCTGYRPILDAMKSFAMDTNIKVPEDVLQDIEELSKIKCPKTGQNCNGNCKGKVTKRPAVVFDDDSQWHWPKTLDDLYGVLSKVSSEKYMLVGGNTGHGVYRRSPDIKIYIDVNDIPDLRQVTKDNDKLVLGGSVSLSEAMDVFQKHSTEAGFEYLQQLWRHFDLIANVPVRNTGTLAGNLMMKHAHSEFPSDIFLTFEALNAKVEVGGKPGDKQSMTLAEFLKSDMTGKVLLSFTLPAYPKERFIFGSYKIMPRAQNAHAYVNGAFLVDLDPKTRNVTSSRICFGGIHPEFVHAKSVEDYLVGKNPFTKTLLPQLFTNLGKEMIPDAVLPDASPEYRKLLACGLLYKFILKNSPEVKDEFKTGGEELKRPVSSGQQTFDTQVKNYPVTQPVTKVEAIVQCSGEATYMNDLPPQPNQVWAALVHATKVGATIVEIDASEALKIPGVLAFYSAKDIPGKNSIVDKSFGFVDEEEIFCASDVKYYYQPLGMIVALTSSTANIAASKVKVMYSKTDKVILPTMKAVFEAKDQSRITSIVKSPIEEIKRPKAADMTVSGDFDIGLQYHYTMEPQTTVALPFEDGLQIWAATQWMDMTQFAIAKMLQMKIKDVQLKVRRLGGGYGGKISRGNFIACAAALAASKLNRPVRLVQTIESMMGSLGKRWACRSEYEFHVNSKGKILLARNTFFEDAGWSINESPVDGHSTLCSKNCYEFKDNNYKIDGNAVTTDAPSHTWCRAPGSVEGIAMIENVLEHIAFETQRDPMDVRIENIPAGHKILELIEKFQKTSEYRARRAEIEEFNTKNRWRKRGLGLCIMEYPIFYFGNYPATVAIYHGDGSVVVSHGGIEMGQGMNTKVAQVAAYTLGIPLELVKIEASDTFNGANSMVTGGAVGSESLCYAVRKSCDILNERLRPVRESMKNPKWLDLIKAAHTKVINLIASDYYKSGDMKPYTICGLSLTEVEIDILTGNHLLKRIDILEDTGESLNPNIDIGQIEGAFVMGLGYWLTEELKYDRQTGELLTNRTWNYKPPGAKDIPIDFRIDLLQKSANPAGFMRSKATGEPAVCLSVSSIFAVQHAIQSARKDAGLKREWQRLGAPTTPETIVLSCGSDPTQFSL
ncbi:uncharacterized protein LOC129919921 [Episyrphus balteatus]|uniref:uncharacterized protein LOC129919921 n=1 Tax=Episyrphus balteatus TaxID=286459 RepID=UPI0024860857|nr:uncharacterized protein LOC129919921 [Episyrphus balteatus]